MKKVIALLLAFTMVVGLVACGAPAGNDEESPVTSNPVGETVIPLDGSWPEETIKIGVALFDPTDETFMAVQEYFEYLSECFNMEFIYSEAISSAEQEFAFIDSCASAGCKGYYAYYNIAGAESIKAVAEHGMYYCQTVEYYDQVEDKTFLAGGYSMADPTDPNGKNGEYLAGYDLAYALAEQGRKHVVYCSGGAAFGVQMFIDRQKGFFDGIAAAQDAGYDIVCDPTADVIAGWPGTDDFAAAQAAAISADYDAVASSFDVAMWFQPVMESGEDIKLAAVGSVTDAYKDFMGMGVVTALVYDCPEYIHGNGLVMLMNCITGHPELSKNADGSPRLQHINRWTITDADTFNSIYDFRAAGNYYLSAEDIAQCLGALNPDATIDTMDEVYDIGMEEAIARVK